ncbi:MAG TPA: RHS repeat domain-containing protein [Stellaceae bacterium]|nr:RHS repeat domain-containing protein [Stellaceae bacterium]
MSIPSWFRTVALVAAVMLMPLHSPGTEAALAANGSVVYLYDALGRVVTASYDTGACIGYSYDANGNRTSQSITVAGGGTAVWGCFTWGQANWGP